VRLRLDGHGHGDAIERAARLFPEATISVFVEQRADFVWADSTKSHMYPARRPN
jgi:hypothetical protein